MLLARLMIGGVIASGVLLLGEAVVGTSGSVDRLIEKSPELGAILLVVGMFLAYLVSKARDEKAERAWVREEARKDREERHAARQECHLQTLKITEQYAASCTELARASERMADAGERCAMDRDALRSVVEANTSAMGQLARRIAGDQ